MREITENAPVILEDLKIYPEYDTEEEIVAEYGTYYVDLINSAQDVETVGRPFAASVGGIQRKAASLAQTKPTTADAYMNVANAIRRLGESSIHFLTKTGKRIKDHKTIDKLFDALIVKWN
ncbi:MAG: hypothetical protein HYS98_08180 [Deltaproteobacteria bacterium]|nr:hypothetical protein [Deltaproteobacteria bacterium]